jgi:Methyltransferase FkbM domain
MNSHYPVKTLTVDYLYEFYGFIPDLVKIDVEGAEMDVLQGAKKIATHSSTLFFVEIHSGPELTIIKNTEDILNWCTQNNYTAWYLKTKSHLTVDSIKSRGRYHALLTPKNNSLPESLLSVNENDPLK